MRTHHQMAVGMSETQIKNGKNPQMVQMAKDIIAAQKKRNHSTRRMDGSAQKAMTDTMPNEFKQLFQFYKAE